MEITSMSQALQLHAQILKSGKNNKTPQDLSKLFTFSALSPSGDLTYASRLFDSLPSPTSFHYNTIIRAYSQSPDPIKALHCFISAIRDPTRISYRPDKFTYPFLVKSCAKLRLTHQGKQLHGMIVKSGLCSDRYVQHSLIHMYAKCRELGPACKVFDEMRDRDVVSWTSIIDGLIDNDRPLEALRLFGEMVEEDRVEVNEATVVSVLRACADAGALGIGRRVHELVKERSIGLEGKVRTALIDMYAKCGCLEGAKQVFYETSVGKDVFAWTAMIAGLASHGKCQEAIELFNQMEEFNITPDERTMTAVLSACRNAGWVSEGYTYLKTMHKNYGLWPTIQHYGCVVDLLARAGRLSDAEEFIRKMPIKPDAVLWRTLIWTCKVHRDMNQAERLIKRFERQKFESNDSGSLVLIGNVYATAGKWDDKARTRELMNKRGLVKPPGSSKIEIDGKIHEFIVGDSSHPEAENIYSKLDEIEEKLREEGYQPKLSEVLLEIDDEEKAFQLSHHSEKLALAFGLIKTSPASEIRIAKNLRSCEDCHAFMKVISKIYQRDIIMRDRIRFHHFSNGDCSCRDYW